MRNPPEWPIPKSERVATPVAPVARDLGDPTWVDSHCHLQLINEADAVLKRAPLISWMVVPGIDAASSQAALDLAERLAGRVFAAVGLHPDHADRWAEERERIAQIAPRAVAVGETGLDYYRNLAPRDMQLAAFRGLLEVATVLDKPVIVHCRDAFREVYEEIEKTGTGDRMIMHCWSGGPNWTRRFLDLGVTFSFAGPVLIGTDDMIKRGAALITPDRTMVETDAPHHCPSHDRKRANEPAGIGLVGAALALVWGMTCDQVAAATTATARRVFGR